MSQVTGRIRLLTKSLRTLHLKARDRYNSAVITGRTGNLLRRIGFTKQVVEVENGLALGLTRDLWGMGSVVSAWGGGKSIEAETRVLDTLKDATASVSERSELLEGIRDGDITFKFLEIEGEVIPAIKAHCLKIELLKSTTREAIDKLTAKETQKPQPEKPAAAAAALDADKEEIANLKKEIARLEGQKSQKAKKITELTESLRRLQENAKNLAEQKKAAVEDAQEKASQISMLSQERDQAVAQLAAANERSAQLQTTLRQKEQAQAVSASDMRNRFQELALSELKTSLMEEADNIIDKIKGLKVDKDKLKEELDYAASLKKPEKSIRDRLIYRLTTLKVSGRSLLDILKQEIAQINLKIKKHLEELRSKSAQLAEMNNRLRKIADGINADTSIFRSIRVPLSIEMAQYEGFLIKIQAIVGEEVAKAEEAQEEEAVQTIRHVDILSPRTGDTEPPPSMPAVEGAPAAVEAPSLQPVQALPPQPSALRSTDPDVDAILTSGLPIPEQAKKLGALAGKGNIEAARVVQLDKFKPDDLD